MRDVIVDTCCLINLWAVRASVLPFSNGDVSKKMKAAASLPDMMLHVVSNVEMEALYVLKPHDDDASRLVEDPIILSPYFQAGLLLRCDLNNGVETEDYVRFATQLDDGESAALSIAKNRGWILATDDRLARSLAARFDVQVFTTPQILREWATHSGTLKRGSRDCFIQHSMLREIRPAPQSSGSGLVERYA